MSNYLDQRLERYGITDEFNSTGVFTGPDSPKGATFDMKKEKWFSLDGEGNIKILFKTLDNRHLSLRSDGRKTVKNQYRTCLSPENRKRYRELYDKKIKYLQDKGTGSIVFHTQGVIDAYLAKTKVNTLYLVEGEFKAFTAWMHSVMWEPTKSERNSEPNLPPPSGLPIMGITGIRSIFNEDKELHSDIQDFIRACDVQNIVLMLDADFRALPASYDPTTDNSKDLGQRLENFFNAAMDFRSASRGRVRDVYLVNIKEEFLNEVIPGTQEAVKGLDDLFEYDTGIKYKRQVLFHLCKTFRANAQNNYFDCLDLSRLVASDIRKHFLLNFKSSAPQDFYKHHKAIIGDNEFRFLGCRYQANLDGVPEMTIHGDSEDYVRIAGKYFKRIQYPTAYGSILRELISWPKGEIVQDYVARGYKNFISSIPKYDRPVNVPENNPDKYRQVINNCYNMYYKIDVEPRKGKWKNIENYLGHVFAQGEDQYDVILDYLALMWNKPTQKLPAIGLVSAEKGTGKSLFLELGRAMFQENAAIIGNQELTDRFNDDFITKLLVGINESLIEKKQAVEMIKSRITERTANMDTKQISRVRVDMIAKWWFTSNNVDDWIRIDDDEARFWGRYVSPFSGPENPNLLDIMTKEVPAFIYYLKEQHEMKYKKETRLWFPASAYETTLIRQVKKESRSQQYKRIEIAIQERFYKYNANSNQAVKFTRLYYSLYELCSFVDGDRIEADAQYVKRVLLREFKFSMPSGVLSKPMPERDPESSIKDGVDHYVKGPAKAGRYWTFKIEDFLEDNEIESLGIDMNHLTMEATYEPDPVQSHNPNELPF